MAMDKTVTYKYADRNPGTKTTHQFAQELLALPDVPVLVYEYMDDYDDVMYEPETPVYVEGMEAALIGTDDGEAVNLKFQEDCAKQDERRAKRELQHLGIWLPDGVRL